MKKLAVYIVLAVLAVGCRNLTKSDADLVNLATQLARKASVPASQPRPTEIVPASFGSGGGTGGGFSTTTQRYEIIATNWPCITVLIDGITLTNICREYTPWEPVHNRIGLICDEEGTVRIDFTESLTPPTLWETWLYLTNWSKILITDETGTRNGFYRVVKMP